MSEKSLFDLPLPEAIRTSSHRLGRNFLAQCLLRSCFYRRAVGFFSSSVFRVASDEWIRFFRKAGKAHFVISPHLSQRDIRALREAVYERPAYSKGFLLDDYDRSNANHTIVEGDFLRGLVATDRVEVRVALRTGRQPTEIYHEKIGIFSDHEGRVLAFSGSANESWSAYVGNFERIDIFRESKERHRALAVERHFDDLWNNSTDGVEVIRLYEALRQNVLLESTETSVRRRDVLVDEKQDAVGRSDKRHPEVLLPASGIRPYEHQRIAIRAWAKAGGHGVLEMATGSGKTITALTLASRLYDTLGPPFAILVIVPLIQLVDQWRSVSKLYGLNPIRCAEQRQSWYQALASGIDNVNNGNRPVLSLVGTIATVQSESFQRLISGIRANFLVVADEMHNYGATASFSALPDNATARLGLSATPDRPYDEDGNARLRTYFGKTVFAYGLSDALRDRILTPYRYFPCIVGLEEDETDTYVELTEKILRFSRDDSEEDSKNEFLKRLLIRRARLIATARGKLPRLRDLLCERTSEGHILVYCGDGSAERSGDRTLVRQIDDVVSLIGNDLGMRCARYTAETSSRHRQDLLEQFAHGEIQVLVAIRCLDEGVDVPPTRTAIMLASATNPRQFVQRRGRVLRLYEGKTRAEIFDLFVTFPESIYTQTHPLYGMARRLVQRQLSRVREFATLAENGPSARNELLALREHFNLLSEG